MILSKLLSKGNCSSRAGFTLVELLVAMVVSGILVTIVFQVILGQSRFVQVQGARHEVQQNARTAVELIGSELRTLPPEGLVAGEDHMITYHVPRVWGILCNSNPAGAGFADVLVPRLPDSSLPGSELGLALQGADGEWGVVADVELGGGANCAGLNPATADADNPDFVALRFTGIGFAADVGPGSQIYLYQQVSYRLGSASLPGEWVLRRLGGGAWEPLAGPVPDESDIGLHFKYFRADSNNPEPTPLADPSAITRVEVTVRTVSRAKFNGVPQSEEVSSTVHLRNAI